MLIALLLFMTDGQAQPYLYSEKEFTLPNGEIPEQVDQVSTLDGGHLVCISMRDANYTNHFTYLIKMDSAGNTEWTKRCTVNFSIHQVVQCPDSSFVLAGKDNEYWGGFKVIKFDPQGNIIYQERVRISGFNAYSAPVLFARNNSNVCMAAVTIDTINFYWHIHLFELDAQGNVQLSNVYHNQPSVVDVAQIDTFSNGDILLAGSWYNSTTSHQFPLIDRIDQNGMLVWNRRVAVAGNVELKPYCIERYGNDQFFISCFFMRPDPFGGSIAGMGLLKIDGSGNVLTSHKYEGYPVQFGDMLTTSNSDLCCIGGDMGGQLMFLRIDTSYNLVSSRSYHYKYYMSIDTLPGGNLSMIGYNYSNMKVALETCSPMGESCDDSVYVFTSGLFSTYTTTSDTVRYVTPMQNMADPFSFTAPVVPLSVVCSTVDVQEQDQPDHSLHVFTDNSIVQVSSVQPLDRIEIFDGNGKLVYSAQCNSNSAEINCSGFPAGVYVVRAMSDGHLSRGKFIKTR